MNWMRAMGWSVMGVILSAVIAASAMGQDGASYDARAKNYRAPEASLAGAKDTPERTAAIMPLFEGKVDEALPKVKALAEGGDVAAAMLLGRLYQRQSKLPVPADPMMALYFYMLASKEGSGEASELIAEMVEQKNLTPAQANGEASFWRNKAREQGWKQQRLAVSCLDWIHGPEQLQCKEWPIAPAMAAKMPPEAQQACPTETEMAALRGRGMTGSLRPDGGSLRLEAGPEARALLIFDHAVPSEEDLKEPDAASVIYIQTKENQWAMLPRDAPLLDRYVILTPGGAGVGQLMLQAQAVDGSMTGGACSEFTR